MEADKVEHRLDWGDMRNSATVGFFQGILFSGCFATFYGPYTQYKPGI